MYDTWQVGASELRDLETRLIYRLDQVDAKWQHRLHALARWARPLHHWRSRHHMPARVG